MYNKIFKFLVRLVILMGELFTDQREFPLET